MKSFPSYAVPLLTATLLLFSGCSSTNRIPISNSLPSGTQLRLNTAEEFETDFEFSGHPEGDEVTVESSGVAEGIYDLNGTLEGRLTQLVRSKFGSISPSSDNKISVSVDEIEVGNESESFSSSGLHEVSVEMSVEIVREGETFTRTIGRRTQIPTQLTEEVVSKVELDRDQLNEFIMQFVVGTDSFIDSNFGVE